MFDNIEISNKFFMYYHDKSERALARFFGVDRKAVSVWKKKKVPWRRLKYLSDSEAVSWDWLIDGIEPKESTKTAKTPKTKEPKFQRARINRRFFLLYSDMNQTEMAAALDVTPGAVSEWKKNKSRVPWEKLQQAVATFGVRWDWLIDGLEPKNRS